VHQEVVVAGAGRPGSITVARTPRIEVRQVNDTAALRSEIQRTGLGSGEVAVVRLALELGIAIVLIDERKARRYAEEAGLIALGCIGLLETLHRKGVAPDLRKLYERLLDQDFRIGLETLQDSLRSLGIRELDT
jgi:hypothetical protein